MQNQWLKCGFCKKSTCISFQTTKRQAISTDNGFIFKKKNKNKNEKKKSHKPFQNYMVIGQADSAKKAG